MKTSIINKNSFYWLIVVGSIIYLFSHLFNLTILPVFADEAIYIRWAQLIIDDWRQYLFFPLNDGKTPLFIWLLIPWQFVFGNQLWAGRFLAVLIGLGQVYLNWRIIKLITKSNLAQFLVIVFTTWLPFWFFHHRMALMDGLLTLCWSGVFYFLLKFNQTLEKKSPFSNQQIWRLALGAGCCWGLSWWTKIPAILFGPTFIAGGLLIWPKWQNKYRPFCLFTGLALIVGLLVFGSLKLQPAFGQLFSRGNDFLFPVTEFWLNQDWQHTLPSWPNYVHYLVNYLTWPVILLAAVGLFKPGRRRLNWFFFLSLMGYGLPIALLGKVVYPRYFLPLALPITLAASLNLSQWWAHYQRLALKSRSKLGLIILSSLLIISLLASFNFDYHLLTNPAAANLVSADQTQYLTSWSAGYGNQETVNLINQAAANQRILVLTEGFFGTLPDGLLLYLHRRPVDNLFIEGIGQPVITIPQPIITKATQYDQVWLVVNSHRLQAQTVNWQFITEFCRPLSGPCLQIWDLTEALKSN